MAGTAFTSYLSELKNYVKGADSADNQTFTGAQVKFTIRDFCKHSWIWREEHDKISVVASTYEYTLTPGTDNSDAADVHALDWVKYKEDGEADSTFKFLLPWVRMEEETPHGNIGAGYIHETQDAPTHFHLNESDKLEIYPVPNSTAAGTENLKPKMVLKPALSATTAPTLIYNDHLECILFGAASRIMGMSGKKWYNPELSEYYGKKYRDLRDNEAKKQRWEGKDRKDSQQVPHRAFTGGARQRSWIY
jgi:hypothetical protein